MAGFRFQEEVTISEDMYVLLRGFPRRVNWLKLVIWIGVSAALLWFHATRWLGALGLIVWLAARALDWWAPHLIRREYRSGRPYLHGPIVCGASDEDVWVQGSDFEVRFPWAHQSGWRRGSGWVWIAGKEGGIAYFKEDSLRSAGLYDALVAQAAAHGVEGDKIGPMGGAGR